MIGALLLVWIGYGDTQSISVTLMPDRTTCEAARVALDKGPEGRHSSWQVRPEKTACLPLDPRPSLLNP